MKRGLITILILVAIIIVLYFSVSKLTSMTVNSSNAFICNDSDNGKEYGIKGVLKMGDIIKGEDFCTNDIRLKEYYCLSNTSWNYKYMICDNECKDGVCVEELEDEEQKSEVKIIEEEVIEEPELEPKEKSIFGWFKNLFS